MAKSHSGLIASESLNAQALTWLGCVVLAGNSVQVLMFYSILPCHVAEPCGWHIPTHLPGGATTNKTTYPVMVGYSHDEISKLIQI